MQNRFQNETSPFARAFLPTANTWVSTKAQSYTNVCFQLLTGSFATAASAVRVVFGTLFLNGGELALMHASEDR